MTMERSGIGSTSQPSCSAFHRWWQDEGIAETIDIDDDALVRRIRALCKVAWSNGEYKARESDMQNNAISNNNPGQAGKEK